MNHCLTTCLSCCKFKKNRLYFAPKITIEEMGHLKLKGLNKKIFRPFNNSRKVYQISPIKSKFSKNLFVCPFLDEKTQICKIYKNRPFDCAFWPFLLMRDKKGKKIFIAHFNKEVCQTTDIMSEKQFSNYLIKDFNRRVRRAHILLLIRKYPELIWEYEPATFIVRELHSSQ